MLLRPGAIGSRVIIAAVSVCSGGGNRVTPCGWQYGIFRRLANGDQTCEIGSNRKIGYPNGGDTPGIALLPVGSLNSRAGEIRSQGSELRERKCLTHRLIFRSCEPEMNPDPSGTQASAETVSVWASIVRMQIPVYGGVGSSELQCGDNSANLCIPHLDIILRGRQQYSIVQ